MAWRELAATVLATICFSLTWPGVSLILLILAWSMWTSVTELCNRQNHVDTVLIRYIIKTSLQWLIIAIGLLVTFGIFVPRSETSFGGNINLRHLSAPVRRSLRQAASLAASPLDVHTDISLYIRGAGFLQEEQGMLVAGDRIATMFPWQIRKPAFDHLTEERGRDPGIVAGDTVILQSPISSNYVSFSRIMTGNAGLVPVPFPSDSMEDGRFIVEPAANLSSQSFWILQEAGSGSGKSIATESSSSTSGVRFYNPVDDCYLATTFRNQDFSYGDDEKAAASLEAATTTTAPRSRPTGALRPPIKIREQSVADVDVEAESALRATFNRFHEIGCTTLPTLSASTFHIVDETRHTGTFGTNLSPPVLPLTLWAKEILLASVRMRHFARLDARNHVRGYTAADQRQYLPSYTTSMGDWCVGVFLTLFGVVRGMKAVLLKRKIILSSPGGATRMGRIGAGRMREVEVLCLLAIASRKLFVSYLGVGAIDQSGVFLTCVASMGSWSVLMGLLG